MEAKLNVKLLRYTFKPETTVAFAARLCYSKSDIKDMMENMTDEQCEKLLNKLIQLGHYSPLEHVSFTFGIEGVSRALTHQLVRHRLASYSQQSQRYVKAEDFKYIIPNSIKNDKITLAKFEKIMKSLQEGYDDLLKTAPKEDARYVLPNAIETKIIVTMNARELIYFFKMRGCKRAQWEIRNLAIEMLKQVKKVAPNIFKNAGPSCLTGPCTEGEMYCGKIEEVREFFKKL